MIIKPDIDVLLSKVDSKYTLCIVSARRARQINEMVHGVRNQALLTQAPEIARITSTKPLTLSLDEIASGDIGYERVAESYK
jgi:DNA-directed RNA polymerase subunit omega